jgi:hypothetical protein
MFVNILHISSKPKGKKGALALRAKTPFLPLGLLSDK